MIIVSYIAYLAVRRAVDSVHSSVSSCLFECCYYSRRLLGCAAAWWQIDRYSCLWLVIVVCDRLAFWWTQNSANCMATYQPSYRAKWLVWAPWVPLYRLKPGFHYQRWRPDLTARVDGWPVSITRQHGPSTRPVNSASGNRSPVNSGR